MERDPVCGVPLASGQALRLDYHGMTYYFCSWHCKHEFEECPEAYVNPDLISLAGRLRPMADQWGHVVPAIIQRES
jgi:YHS domain-containing protein